ncbi:MAG: hypothetical protein E7260_05920 [Lachnospiraceae bacterium]|nr:hypothetical protein [Lachnospiraceae bacterium]
MKKSEKTKTPKEKGKRSEFVRKMLVSLKKNPQLVPLFALTVSFLVYSLNLTSISNTTAKIYGPHMGLCAFVAMLFSILSYVCMFSAYPKRQKPNKLMIALMLVMYAVIIFVDGYYFMRIQAALTRAQSPIKITKATAYISTSKVVLIVHIVTIVITMACVVLEPVFAKMLKKINTSVEIEATREIAEIDISDED